MPSSASPSSAGPSAEVWLGWLERASGAAAQVVRDALDGAAKGGVSEGSVSGGRGAAPQSDALSVRLAFGQLNQKVHPTPLASSAGQEPPSAELPATDLLEDTAVRIAFLVGLAEGRAERRPAREFTDILTTLYRTGSDREQIAILRAFPFLPDQESLVPLAREASRTNDVAVFSALACDSAFPARHLPHAAFDQLVLKALFIGVPLARIRDLHARITPELQRMVADFAEERRAAGRPVPADVPPLLELRRPATGA